MQNSDKSKLYVWHVVTQSFSGEKWLAGRQARLSVVPKERCYVWGPIRHDSSGMTFRPTRHYWSIWACQHRRMEAWGIFGENGGWVMWGGQSNWSWGWGGGWLEEVAPWGTRRGQAVLVVIKEAPIKRCPGPWLHCQVVRKRMHGGGDAEGHLIDKSCFLLWVAPRNECKAIFFRF